MQKTPAKLCSLSAFPSVCALVWLFRSQRPIRGHHFCLRTSKSPLSCNSKILQRFQKTSIICNDTFLQRWFFFCLLCFLNLPSHNSKLHPPPSTSVLLSSLFETLLFQDFFLLTAAGKLHWATLGGKKETVKNPTAVQTAFPREISPFQLAVLALAAFSCSSWSH